MMNGRKIAAILILALFVLSSCNRSTCPTYDSNTGEQKIKKSKKTTSGVYPKGMK
ncbi:MAG: hypothetical protein WD048_01390 [Chitinophagales bacterium]